MGYDMITMVYRRNENGEYEEMTLHNKAGKEVYIFPTKDHLLNTMLTGNSGASYDIEPIAYKRKLPKWFVEEMDDPNDEPWMKTEGTYYDYLELAAWANSETYSNVVDWLASEDNGINWLDNPDEAIRRSPLKDYVGWLNVLLEAYGIYYPVPGQVLVFTIDSY